MDKDTTDAIQKTLAFLWTVGVASLAGAVKSLQRFVGDNPPHWSWGVFAIQIFTAGFVGLVTNWLLSGWNFNPNYLNFAIAVGGWGGGETIVFFQRVFRDSISRASGISKDEDAKD